MVLGNSYKIFRDLFGGLLGFFLERERWRERGKWPAMAMGM